MPAQMLEMKHSASVASVLKLVKAPLKVPAWSMAVLIVIVGVYAYAQGRLHPVHHYVPYVGYPLVLDTTTGKACYSAPPKPSEDGAPVNASYNPDGSAALPDPGTHTGPAIPLCGK
jgi:hypothetical protein